MARQPVWFLLQGESDAKKMAMVHLAAVLATT
jgi:hypothetical protein